MSVHQNEVVTRFVTFIENHNESDRLKKAYYHLGFICSVQILPELIDLELWINFLSGTDQAISFNNELEAIEYMQMLTQLIEYIQTQYQDSAPLDALHCEQWLDENNHVMYMGADFAKGFLEGVEFFNDKWSLLEDNPATQNLFQTCIFLITKLNPPKTLDPGMESLFKELPDVVEILSILPQLLSHLAYTAARN